MKLFLVNITEWWIGPIEWVPTSTTTSYYMWSNIQQILHHVIRRICPAQSTKLNIIFKIKQNKFFKYHAGPQEPLSKDPKGYRPLVG